MWYLSCLSELFCALAHRTWTQWISQKLTNGLLKRWDLNILFRIKAIIIKRIASLLILEPRENVALK